MMRQNPKNVPKLFMKHIYGGHNDLTMSVFVKDARVRNNRGR